LEDCVGAGCACRGEEGDELHDDGCVSCRSERELRIFVRLTIVRKVVTEEEEQSLSLYSRVTTVFVHYRWLDTVVLHPGAITDQPRARPSHNESNL
jgi:hypothetical protein